MTVLVTVQPTTDGMSRVRRYDGQHGGHVLCTHEGFYQPQTVTPPNVLTYLFDGAEQDRRGWPTGFEASWGGYGKQPA